MNISKKKYLAIDTSYDHAMVVAFDENEILFERSLPERNAHSRNLCAAIEDAAKQIENFDAVLVGLGPGSFIGTRIALATTLGFTFGKDVPLMGFCSHFALASSIEAPQRELALVMKASGELSYVSIFVQHDQQWQPLVAPAVLSPAEIAQKLNPTILHAGNRPSATLAINGPTALGVYRAAMARLDRDGILDESSFIKPNYVKEPSVSPLPTPSGNRFKTFWDFFTPTPSIAKSFFLSR